MAISVKNITKIYGEQKALDNVNFEVKTGEVIGFLGPNGAGKSTMMKILTCYLPASAGTASVNGYDVAGSPQDVKRSVGYLPESNPLYFDMYVREYLEYAAGVYGASNVRKRADEMIGITGLSPERHKKIGALSKGYKQRVGLAQAMIHNPSVLILDEPTSGLDPNQLVDIRNLITELGKEKTVMLSTHIMQEAEAMCSRILIINKGNLVADKSTAEITRTTGNRQVVLVEFDKPVTEGELKKIKGVQQVLHSGNNRYEISASDKEDIRSQLFAWAVEKGLTILTIAKSDVKLEDVFRNLTGKK
ncbi:MAG: gliding motility-associated ABC transporter ATP-binding subunit GldA [Bacteroidia bacterium]|nr:gliding motility-associated ABC transporter ATP-binding subunit GldA [Bacteroidia bacterium]